jgi:hypothetical protein
MDEITSTTVTQPILDEKTQITEQTERSDAKTSRNRNNKVEPISSNSEGEQTDSINATNQQADSVTEIESEANVDNKSEIKENQP